MPMQVKVGDRVVLPEFGGQKLIMEDKVLNNLIKAFEFKSRLRTFRTKYYSCVINLNYLLWMNFYYFIYFTFKQFGFVLFQSFSLRIYLIVTFVLCERMLIYYISVCRNTSSSATWKSSASSSRNESNGHRGVERARFARPHPWRLAPRASPHSEYASALRSLLE